MAPSLQSLFLLSLTLLSLSPICSSNDNLDLVFKSCANQTFKDTNSTSLKTILDTLISRSSVSKFYKSSSGNGINGLFQCRNYLSIDECEKCIKNISGLTQKLCGKSIAARVQLNGCHLSYEVSGYKQVSETELLFKVCGSNRSSGIGLGDKLDLALGEIVKGLANDVNGGYYYAYAYRSMLVLVQCEGDLSRGDCMECVKSAIDKAKSECGSSISAKIYLQECFISYTYYLNGVASNQQTLSPSGIIGRNTQKIVAIVLGGLFGVGMIMACFLFIKSASKKKQLVYKIRG